MVRSRSCEYDFYFPLRPGKSGSIPLRCLKSEIPADRDMPDYHAVYITRRMLPGSGQGCPTRYMRTIVHCYSGSWAKWAGISISCQCGPCLVDHKDGSTRRLDVSHRRLAFASAEPRKSHHTRSRGISIVCHIQSRSSPSAASDGTTEPRYCSRLNKDGRRL